MNMIIREVNPEDAGRLLEIYSYYVENTAVSFECKTPTLAEFRERVEKISKDYPYLVAEVDGKIAGYIYAARYRTRAAFDWCVETSVYIDKEYHRKGIGKLLYEELEAILLKQNVVNAYAVIAVPVEKEDEYLTFDSKNFHEKIGYKDAGTLESIGNKFGRWYSLLTAHKVIHPYCNPPMEFIPYSELEIYGREICN